MPHNENFDLKVVYLPVDSLTPYENNTRKHAPDDIEAIKKSILDLGFLDPVGIWGDQNIIVEGHGRQIAAKELGLESVPCIRLDHLTDTQRRDYAIRHNRTAELSGWDFGKLEEEIARLEIEGVDLSGLKFDLDVLNGGGDTETDKEVPLKEEYQLIVDCEDEADMQEKYDVLQEAGIECRVSTL